MEQLMLALAESPQVAARKPEVDGALQLVVASSERASVALHLSAAGLTGAIADDFRAIARLGLVQRGQDAWVRRGKGAVAYALWMPWADSAALATLELGLCDAPAAAVRRFADTAEMCVAMTRDAVAKAGGQHPLAQLAEVEFNVGSARFKTPSYVGPERRSPTGRRHTVGR
jgi:hypothetical protein